MVVIEEDKTERHFIPGNELPRFWEGKEVLGGLPTVVPRQVPAQEPMAVES